MRHSALGALTTLGLLLALMVSAPALAKTRTIAPPGNSGVSQYDETIPTARGNRPSSTVHVNPGSTGGSGGAGQSGGGGGGGGAGGSAGGAGRSGGAGGSGAISSSTQRAFARHGSAGRAAAALARATAPAPPRVRARPARAATSSPPPAVEGFSPVKSLLQTFTGSAKGGLGALLPIILVVSAIGAMALAVVRRRRAT